ncbi:thermonuclease family protein [Desulfonatronovibrio hydrogenovorans]|uniref:thermonuclease family protein n=1 Tax=Desulfonatronovibrio hydrogenovorans TaxID=53245 RepID=UPI00068D3417|nr:thermonuclease family protein [Desulfonatronovibrio hydrogenovorans]
MKFAAKLFIGSLFVFLLMGTVDAGQVRVAWVPDGDTLILENRDVVRLKGIDAPETGYNGGPAQYFALEAAQRLQELVRGNVITLEPGEPPQDRYGRILAYAYLPTGENINVLLVREGYAFYFPHQNQNQEISSQILAAQQKAMEEGRGFWPGVLAVDKPGKEYVGNTRSKRFHVLDCGYGQRISRANQRFFSSLYQAFYEGFAPCRRCTPWPDEKR